MDAASVEVDPEVTVEVSDGMLLEAKSLLERLGTITKIVPVRDSLGAVHTWNVSLSNSRFADSVRGRAIVLCSTARSDDGLKITDTFELKILGD